MAGECHTILTHVNIRVHNYQFICLALTKKNVGYTTGTTGFGGEAVVMCGRSRYEHTVFNPDVERLK